MALETIPRGIKDPNYRYKMPAIITKVEGKGNGIKTVITNMVEVSKSLARPPTYPTKFFGFELGTITKIDDGKYIVNGEHDQNKLMEKLDAFIDKFVMCKQCENNPETYIVIRDDEIELQCISCGGRTPVDTRHKLCTFILKNPPPPPNLAILRERQKLAKAEGEQATTKKGSKKRKEKKQKEEKGGKGEKGEKGEEDDGDDDDVVWHTDTSKEAAEQRRKAMLDTTSELAAKLLSTGISERPDPLVSMHAFLSTNPSNAQVLAQIKKEKEEHKLDDEQTARLTFLSLFDSNVYKQIKSDKLEVIKKVVTNTAGQAGILGGLTELGKKDVAVQKVMAHVLKHLYDEDVLAEEEIARWHETQPKAVKLAAQVFVDWLSTAEEEGSD